VARAARLSAATALLWHEVALTGTTAHEFSEQIFALEPFLAKNWQARHSPKTGNPVYERPVALVLYRDDFRFLLDDVIPRQGKARADYDLVLASQPYRARVPVEFKASRVIAPLARALGPAGGCWESIRTATIPGSRSCRRSGPTSSRSATDGTTSCARCVPSSGKDARHYNFNAYSDARAVFRYDMHTLPTEISASIGTSTLFAAWNAAVYVAQIDDERPRRRARLSANTWKRRREALQAHGGLWFLDESYVISKKRG
jgi:hypothetical protein